MRDLDLYDLLAIMELGHNNQFWDDAEAATVRPVRDVTEEYIKEKFDNAE